MFCVVLGLSPHAKMELVTLRRSKSAHKINVNKLFQKAREILNSEDQDVKEIEKIKVSLSAKLEKILKVDEDILLALCQNSEVDEEEIAAETEEADKLTTEIRTIIIEIDTLMVKEKEVRKPSPRRVLPKIS